MSTPVKIALYAAGIGILYWLIVHGKNQLSEWGSKITFKITGFGKPEFRNGSFSVPLIARVTNLTPVPIPISNLVIRLSILKGGMYQTVGITDPTGAFTINQGDNNITLFPRVDVAKLNPVGGDNLLNSALNILSNQNPLLDLKVEADITVQGITFTEAVVQKVYMNQLLNAA